MHYARSKVKTLGTRGTALAICPSTNRKGKKDVTGAFLPEALRFTELRAEEDYTALLRQFDNDDSKRRRRREVEEIIQLAPYPIDCLALFMHGYRRGLQSGHNSWNVKNLAKAIASNASPNIKIALYACDTGRDADRQRADDNKPGPGGEGGFADKLRDSLVHLGLDGGWVDAHTVTAHTTKAPYVRRFYINEEAQHGGGGWLVTPRSPEWKKWRTRLQKDRRFRLSFPLFSQSQIYEAL